MGGTFTLVVGCPFVGEGTVQNHHQGAGPVKHGVGSLIPTGSKEREVLGLGVFLLPYFPLVKI